MKRRSFLTTIPGLSLLKDFSINYSGSKTKSDAHSLEFGNLPNFCSHEHWGSLFSMGDAPGGFRADYIPGATPVDKTTLVHILIDPYMTGNLKNTGINPWMIESSNGKSIDVFELSQTSPSGAMKVLKPVLRDQQLTGTYQSTRIGIKLLYDYDIEKYDDTATDQVSNTISENYGKMFEWYSETMSKVNFTNLIRPVHPEFYYESTISESAKKEQEFTNTVLRIDVLLEFWYESERKKKIVGEVGINPGDPISWRKFLVNLFETAKSNGAVGIKQLQAYMRNLDFEKPSDSEVKFTGELNLKEQYVFKNWIVNECCKLAHDYKWPHQIHVGTHNLPHSNPLPLQKLASNYKNQKLVLLHSWPFNNESGYLAKNFTNIYLDTCWMAILNPEFLRESINKWLNYVPLSKITMSNDSTSIEMAVGASYISQKILIETLTEKIGKLKSKDSGIDEIIRDFLNNNALKIYT